MEVESPGTEAKLAEQSTNMEQGTRVKPTEQGARAEQETSTAEQTTTMAEQTEQRPLVDCDLGKTETQETERTYTVSRTEAGNTKS